MAEITLHNGDSLDVLRGLADASIDSIVTDPPYALVSIVKRFGGANAAPARDGDVYARASAGFMGKKWDTGETAFAVEFWAECLRVLKPGGHVVAFSGTRTYHRLAVAIEDAGFEIRDQLAWVYSTGFPKSHSVNKGAKDAICNCFEGARSKEICKREMRSLRDADLSEAVNAQDQRGEVLQSSMSESSAPVTGRSEFAAAEIWESESGMEGRRDLSEAPRELCVGKICSMPGKIRDDGEARRLHNGTSPDNGYMGRTATNESRDGASYRPQSIEQRPEKSGTLAGQSEPQVSGAWPLCVRCSKPIISSGLGTALKPAWEPIVLARKPLDGTVAANVLAYGTGAINVDGCRIEGGEGGSRDGEESASRRYTESGSTNFSPTPGPRGGAANGRFPANILHDGSPEVVGMFPDSKGQSGVVDGQTSPREVYGEYGARPRMEPRGDSGSAARFFYSAKADKIDRWGSKHPTVKPVDLMRWLCRLVTPPGGVVLDPFAGSGSTGVAAYAEGFDSVLIEREAEYAADIRARIDHVKGLAPHSFSRLRSVKNNGSAGPLFASEGER